MQLTLFLFACVRIGERRKCPMFEPTHTHIPPPITVNYTAGISSKTQMCPVNYIMSAKNRNALILVNRCNRSHSTI